MFRRMFAVAVIGLCLTTEGATAGPIFVANAGFESPTVGNGSDTVGLIDGWSALGISGVFNPPSSSFTGEAPEGLQVAYISGNNSLGADGPVEQTLAANLAAGTYELRVLVGFRREPTIAFAGYRIDLLVGGAVVATDDNTLTVNRDEFVEAVVSYTALPTDPNIGQALGIRLSVLNSGGANQTNFDDVRLNFNPAAVPEPASAVLLGAGGLALAAARRRRRK